MDILVKKNWKIWEKDHTVEARTFYRAQKKLPEMESAKQLRILIKKVYKKGMSILDVGCAAGHYYHSLLKIDRFVKFAGIDATKKYIDYANQIFKKYNNASFFKEDIFKISKKHKKRYDISYSCNLLLHLPSIELPIKNLINATKKYCFIRTLVSKRTHLSKFLYDDRFNKSGLPINFVYQNTYSYNFLTKILKKNGAKKIEFIDDKSHYNNINKEFQKFKNKQDAVTKALKNGQQIAGSKVFEWKWIKITL